MTAVRFELTNPSGKVEVEDGMLSAPPQQTPKAVAEDILTGAEPGWQIRLWHDVDLVRPLGSLGKPTVVMTT